MVNQDLIGKIEKMISLNDEIEYGKGEAGEISYTCSKNGYKTANFLVYLNTKEEIAVIWNLKRQRQCEHCIKTQSLTKCSWKNVLPVREEIKDWYKQMGRKEENPYEKVIAMSFDTLIYNKNNLAELLKFDKEDSDILPQIIEEENLNSQPRTKRTVENWNRDIKFRKKVLKAYGSQCAICRCKEEKILEAAHIIPVYEGGSDETKNGICLCRNHHAMFDKNLIKIDFKNLKLSYVSDTVQSMPWFKEFSDKYNEKILNVQKTN